jgi:hypothetical protein
MFLFLSRFYNLAVAFAVAAERSIDTIIYTLMPALLEKRGAGWGRVTYFCEFCLRQSRMDML